MTDESIDLHLVAHQSDNLLHRDSCVGRGDVLEFLENDLVEFRYPNSSCPFCMTSLRLGKRFPMSQWKQVLDAKHFTLVPDPVRDHSERMRVVKAHEVSRKAKKP